MILIIHGLVIMISKGNQTDSVPVVWIIQASERTMKTSTIRNKPQCLKVVHFSDVFSLYDLAFSH